MDKDLIIKILKIVAYLCTAIAAAIGTTFSLSSCTVAYNVGISPQQRISQPTTTQTKFNSDSAKTIKPFGIDSILNK